MDNHSDEGPTLVDMSSSIISIAIGVLAITVGIAFQIIPYWIEDQSINWIFFVSCVLIGVFLLVYAAYSAFPKHLKTILEVAETHPEPVRSKKLYGTYLVGIGFVLLLQSVVCAIIFSGLAVSIGENAVSDKAQKLAANLAVQKETGLGDLQKIFGANPQQSTAIVGLLAMSTIVAILGALFFFANSMWKKMDAPEEDPFDHRIFWGGLWFRIGEAILFSLVFFLVFRYYAPTQYLILPLVSLLVGMFLKSGESLVAGIATRVFASVQALIPNELGQKNVLKLLTFVLEDPDSNDDNNDSRVEELVAILKSLSGVEHVELRKDPLIMSVEYDASVVTPVDIQRKVELKGFKMTVRK